MGSRTRGDHHWHLESSKSIQLHVASRSERSGAASTACYNVPTLHRRRRDRPDKDERTQVSVLKSKFVLSPGVSRPPELERWLGGLEPAWVLLDQASLRSLRGEPSRETSGLRLATDLNASDLASSAVVRNAVVLLDAAARGDGLKLTATGNLARTVVSDMIDCFEWPGYETASALALNKVVNEPDFAPLHFVRMTLQSAGLLRRRKGALIATKAAQELVSQRRLGALQAILFHVAFWRLDLSYFGRGLLGSWPQPDIGVALWSLAAAAWHWETPERLSRLCTIPTPEVLEAGTWDRGAMAFEARVLRPLFWFGLLENRSEKFPPRPLGEDHLFRKSPVFGRFLEFDVKIATQAVSGNA